VALASYAMDSHVVGYFADAQGRLRIEGAFFENIRAFPISYRALLPKRAECSNLLVPVCLSASHAAYGSVRMEPVFMMLGQSAATAALLALQSDTPLHDLPYATLQRRLVADGQILALSGRTSEGGKVRGPTSAAAIAAVGKLQAADFLAAADASTNFWQNAARPGATCEAERVAALIVAAAQRFAPETTRVEAALPVLAGRGARIDVPAWITRTQPKRHCDGADVAELLVEIARLF
jgi:hypothetical protein